jgi:hypothetical protein
VQLVREDTVEAAEPESLEPAAAAVATAVDITANNTTSSGQETGPAAAGNYMFTIAWRSSLESLPALQSWSKMFGCSSIKCAHKTYFLLGFLGYN